MSIAILGGIKSLEREYKKLAKANCMRCKIFNRIVPEFSKKIQNVDVIILFTDTVSHKMAKESKKLVKKHNINYITLHSSSISNLKKTLNNLSCQDCNQCIFQS